MDRVGRISRMDESQSDLGNNRSRMNHSAMSNYSGTKIVALEKSNHPTLIDLMGDEVESNATSMKDIIFK